MIVFFIFMAQEVYCFVTLTTINNLLQAYANDNTGPGSKAPLYLSLLVSLFILLRGARYPKLSLTPIVSLVLHYYVNKVYEYLDHHMNSQAGISLLVIPASFLYKVLSIAQSSPVKLFIICFFVSVLVIYVTKTILYFYVVYLLILMHDFYQNFIARETNGDQVSILVYNVLFVVMGYIVLCYSKKLHNLLYCIMFALFGSIGFLVSSELLLQKNFGFTKMFDKVSFEMPLKEIFCREMGIYLLLVIFSVSIQRKRFNSSIFKCN